MTATRERRRAERVGDLPRRLARGANGPPRFQNSTLVGFEDRGVPTPSNPLPLVFAVEHRYDSTCTIPHRMQIFN